MLSARISKCLLMLSLFTFTKGKRRIEEKRGSLLLTEASADVGRKKRWFTEVSEAASRNGARAVADLIFPVCEPRENRGHKGEDP